MRTLAVVPLLVLAACSQHPPVGEALALCTQSLKAAAKNPSSARIPSPTTSFSREGMEFIFSWDHGDGLAFQNGFGAMIDSQADCYVSPDGRKVTFLQIDGKSFVSPPVKKEMRATPAPDDEAAKAARAAEAAGT